MLSLLCRLEHNNAQWCEQFNVHCADSTPSGFLRVSSMNSWYKVVKQNLEWSMAGLKCKQFHKDAHLLVINDEQEQLAITRMLNGLSLSLLTVYCIAFYRQKCYTCLSVCRYAAPHLWNKLPPSLRVRRKKKNVVSGNPTDPSFYPPTLKILWTYLCWNFFGFNFNRTGF